MSPETLAKVRFPRVCGSWVLSVTLPGGWEDVGRPGPCFQASASHGALAMHMQLLSHPQRPFQADCPFSSLTRPLELPLDLPAYEQMVEAKLFI